MLSLVEFERRQLFNTNAVQNSSELGQRENPMRFDKLDLNLLVALDALLEQQSVSVVAERLGLTQSAISSSLARLRDYFDDELLMRDGRRMVLTPKARHLAPNVRDVLLQIRSTITTPSTFDHSTAKRRFTIMCSDYVNMILARHLLRLAEREAPGLAFNFMGPDTGAIELFERGEIDLLILADAFTLLDHPYRPLFKDEPVVVCWTGNPEIGDSLTEEEFFHLGHVAAAFRNMPYTSVYEKQLADLGLARRIEVSVASFSLVPFAVIDTHRIAVMHRRHAKLFAQLLPLKLLRMPLPLAPVVEVAQWPRHRGADPGLDWLLGQMERLIGDILP